jgi:hypothetical protein
LEALSEIAVAPMNVIQISKKPQKYKHYKLADAEANSIAQSIISGSDFFEITVAFEAVKASELEVK